MFSSGEQTFQGNWLEAVMAPPGSGCPVGAPQYALFGAWGASGLPFPRSVSSLPTPHHVLGHHQSGTFSSFTRFASEMFGVWAVFHQ